MLFTIMRTPMVCFIMFSILIIAFSLILVSVSAENGPHPSKITATSYDSPEYRGIYSPIIPRWKVRACKEELTITGEELEYSYSFGVLASADLKWCNLPIRVRTLELLGTKDEPIVRVVDVRKEEFTNGQNYIYADIKPICRRQRIYFEACYRLTKFSRAICKMSDVLTFDGTFIYAPRLEFRPPIKLELAPGDTAKITTQIINATDGGSTLGNGGFDTDKRSVLMREVAKSKDGRNLKVGLLKEQTKTVLHITKRDTSGWRRRLFDGAVAYMEYASPRCPDAIETINRYRYETTIKVSENVSSLVKQDTRLPEFEQPEFVPIVSGRNAIVQVKATNPGGGMRADGTSTELHYQWYVWDFQTSTNPTHPSRLSDETKPTLTLKNYDCEPPFGSGPDIDGLQEYMVDVCNTFGCKRSDFVMPRFIRSDGKIVFNYEC